MDRTVAAFGAAAVLAAAGVLLAAGRAEGSGLESNGIGARGRAMGYAMVAVADDWTAIHYNPAGLVQVEGRVFGSEYELFSGTMTSTKSLRNLNVGANPLRGDFVDPFGDEPTSFAENSISATIHSGELGYVVSSGGFAYGLGLYGSGSGSGWKDTAPVAGGDSLEAEIAFTNASINVPLAVAYQLRPGLSVGLRLGVHYGMLTVDNNKYRTGVVAPYTSATTQDTDGVGLSVDIGMLWKPDDRLALGAVVKLPHTFEKTGETTTDQSLMAIATTTDTTVEEEYPLRIALGCAYRPDEANLVAFSVTFLNWSDYNQKIEYSPEVPPVLVGTSGNFGDWGDTAVVGLGYERLLGDRWALRCGLAYDQAPEPEDARTLVGGQVVDSWKFSVGAGVAWERTSLDFGYMHTYGPEVAGYVPDAEYGMSLHELFVGFEKRF